MTPSAHRDETYLSDSTFTTIYLLLFLVSIATASGITNTWWRLLAFTALGAIYGRILERRLHRNRTALTTAPALPTDHTR